MVYLPMMQQLVLDLATKDFQIIERHLHKDEIRLLDETFIPSSIREIVPIVAIDAIRIGDGKPGARTRKIMELFRKNTDMYAG